MDENSPYAEERAVILERLAWVRSQPDGDLMQLDTGKLHLLIRKQAGQIGLYFRDPQTDVLEGPMSRLDLERPLYLSSEYAQVMMLVLLWRPDPQRICLLGFGGGRLSLVLHTFLQQTRIDNIDIDAVLASVAERYFGVVFDARQTLTIADARAFLQQADPASYDIIIQDAFGEGDDYLDHLATSEFYQLCQEHLTPAGILCVNLLRSDPTLFTKLGTLLSAFRYSYVVELKYALIVFASTRVALNAAEIQRRAEDLQQRYQFEFPFLSHAAALRVSRDLEPDLLHRARAAVR